MAIPIIAATITGLNTRTRPCPQCGHTQSASALTEQSTVSCHRCGAAIPPPPTGAGAGAATGQRDKK